MKKTLITLGIVILAIFVFFAIKLNQLEDKIHTELAKYHISVQNVSFSLVPKPSIRLEKVEYANKSAVSIESVFDFSSLISGENLLPNALNIKGFKWNPNADNSADIQATFNVALEKNARTAQLIFTGDNHIQVELAKPFYGKHKSHSLHFKKGDIVIHSNDEYEAKLDAVQINQQLLGHSGNLEARLNSQEFLAKGDDFQAYYRRAVPNNAELHFDGGQFPIERLVKIFGLPDTIRGNADFNIRLQLDQGKLSQGDFRVLARNGELQGVNLLQMALQYLPVNYDEKALQQQNLNTPFEEFYSEALLEQSQLTVKQISLKTTALTANGAGVVNLHNTECDVNLNVQPTQEKYTQFVLPIQFFGDCRSPQYKIKFNRDFRHSLKELIKQKLR